MKTYKNTLLFYKFDLKKDILHTYFIFKINLFNYKIERISFDLSKYKLKQIVLFYKDLAEEWNDKYRI